MAEKKISELDAATTLAGDEVVPVVQDGVTKRATVTELRGPPQITVSDTPPEDPVLNQLWFNTSA